MPNFFLDGSGFGRFEAGKSKPQNRIDGGKSSLPETERGKRSNQEGLGRRIGGNPVGFGDVIYNICSPYNNS